MGSFPVFLILFGILTFSANAFLWFGEGGAGCCCCSSSSSCCVPSCPTCCVPRQPSCCTPIRPCCCCCCPPPPAPFCRSPAPPPFSHCIGRRWCAVDGSGADSPAVPPALPQLIVSSDIGNVQYRAAENQQLAVEQQHPQQPVIYVIGGGTPLVSSTNVSAAGNESAEIAEQIAVAAEKVTKKGGKVAKTTTTTEKATTEGEEQREEAEEEGTTTEDGKAEAEETTATTKAAKTTENNNKKNNATAEDKLVPKVKGIKVNAKSNKTKVAKGAKTATNKRMATIEELLPDHFKQLDEDSGEAQAQDEYEEIVSQKEAADRKTTAKFGKQLMGMDAFERRDRLLRELSKQRMLASRTKRVSEGQTKDGVTCNSKRMARTMAKAIVEEISISKRLVKRALEYSFAGARFDVICAAGDGALSYSIYGRRYCEVKRRGVICVAFD